MSRQAPTHFPILIIGDTFRFVNPNFTKPVVFFLIFTENVKSLVESTQKIC